MTPDHRLESPVLRREIVMSRQYGPSGSYKAAAWDLGISETTFRQHLSALYRRMGCVSSTHAASRSA